MRNLLQVRVELNRIICYSEADGWGSAEPYLWPIYFKIDGTTCRLNEALMLEGTASIFTTNGSHANLSSDDVDGGDTVTIPAMVGIQNMILTPIPVPDFVRAAGTDDVSAIAGCIIILMEEDNVTDDGANEGYRTLATAVQNALDGLIPTLGFLNQTISDDDINNLTSQIQNSITDAIKNQQNFFENVWSWLNADDTIGTAVWKFSGDDLIATNPMPLQKRWPNEVDRSDDNGDWEIFGTIATEEIPSCPANAVQEIFDSLFEPAASTRSMKAMHDFKNNDMKKHQGLWWWWNIARANAHYLKHALKDKEVAMAAATIFKDMPVILKERDKALSDEHFSCGLKVLNHLLLLNTKDRQSRKNIKRSIDALHMLKGKSINNIFETLSSIKPARYPSINTMGSNLKFKINKANSKY